MTVSYLTLIIALAIPLSIVLLILYFRSPRRRRFWWWAALPLVFAAGYAMAHGHGRGVATWGVGLRVLSELTVVWLLLGHIGGWAIWLFKPAGDSK
jgi:hypothetical protein